MEKCRTSDLNSGLLQEPKAIKFYYPYLAFALANILSLYMSWYTGKQAYIMIEGKTLIFAVKSFIDATGCIAGLIFVPQDKLLEGFFDMKSWFMRIKKAYFFIVVLYFLVFEIQIVLFYSKVSTTENLIGGSVFVVIMILLNMVSAFSKNDYYLSFHGTLVVVMFSFSFFLL